MRTLRDWIEHVNTNEDNVSVELVEFLPGMHHVAVSVCGSYALDVCVNRRHFIKESDIDLINADIDTLELELSDGANSTFITGVNPYGLTAYIKEAY